MRSSAEIRVVETFGSPNRLNSSSVTSSMRSAVRRGAFFTMCTGPHASNGMVLWGYSNRRYWMLRMLRCGIFRGRNAMRLSHRGCDSRIGQEHEGPAACLEGQALAAPSVAGADASVLRGATLGKGTRALAAGFLAAGLAAGAFTAGLAAAFLATGLAAGLATAFLATGLAAAFFAGAAFTGAALTAGGALPRLLASASMRALSTSRSRDVGTPSLDRAVATRSSKMFSSLSHCPAAREPMSLAMLVTRLVASEIFSSATAWVLRWMDRPSFTRASNTLPPSSWALEKGPSPASQICWAESLTVLDNWAPVFFLSLLSFCSFLTMWPPMKG